MWILARNPPTGELARSRYSYGINGGVEKREGCPAGPMSLHPLIYLTESILSSSVSQSTFSVSQTF